MRLPEQRLRGVPTIDRRRFLASGLSALAATSLAIPGAARSRRQPSSEHGSPLETALTFDSDLDGQFANRMHVDATSGDDRESAVHVTSNGVETTDYAVSLVDLRDASLTLEDVTESGTLTYDYYRGSESTSVVPGTVYLLLQTADGVYSAFRIGRDQREGGWHTRDVSAELSVGRWRARDLEGSGSGANELSAETVVNGLFQGDTSDLFEDVPGRFGTDAQLLGIGIGNGQFSEPVVVDVYFDSVQAADQSYPIPAIVRLESTFERDDSGSRLDVVVEPPSGTHGGHLSLDDVDRESIRLAPYSPVAPPALGGGGAGSTIEPVGTERAGENDGLRIAFELDEQGGQTSAGDQPMLVSGTVQGEREIVFLAASEDGVTDR